MRNFAMTVLIAVVLALGSAATAQAVPPGGEGTPSQTTEVPTGGGKPQQQNRDCAGGIPGIEQLCDGVNTLLAPTGALIDGPSTVAGAIGARGTRVRT
jgi:hypothetical protein